MKNNLLDSAQPTETTVSAEPDRNYSWRRLIAIFWFMAVMLGAFQAWDARHAMNPDGINYLDMGDAYLRGDWNMAINAFWSPFYSWLLGLALLVLKPSSYWEFSIVHLVNFAIYLGALGCFHFFLLELIRYHRHRTAGFSGDGGMPLPEWTWLAMGYILFIWSSLNLITIRVVTPDMCVAAFVYLASGILLRIRRGASWFTFALLGLVLGFGYLAKAPMFPLAFVFLGVGMFSVGNLRRAMPRVLIALVIFLLIGGLFIVALSKAKGRLTFGDSGKLNYAWKVNGITEYVHWQGEFPGNGIPLHPTRKIFDVPAIFEFGTPIGGTYPPGYDQPYWYEGVTIHFDLKGQVRVLEQSAKTYFRLFFHLQAGLVVGCLILYFMSRRRWLGVKDIAQHWNLFVPAIAALGMYSLVHVESRFIAAFVVLLWMGVFSGVRLSDSQESRRLVACVTAAMLTVMMITIGFLPALKAYSTARDLIRGRNPWPHAQWQVADGLNRMEVQPGEKVAWIGNPANNAWARLARVQKVAEIPSVEADNFWAADHLVKSQVIKTFARTEATVIVTKNVPSSASTIDWQRIGNTDYYAYILPR